MSRQSITRQALYDAVWAQPMSRLAPTYGVTGTGLKKVCDRHDIPTPDRGYWAKLANNKPVRRPPLPISKLKAEAVVSFHGQPISALPPVVRQAQEDARTRAAHHAAMQTASASEPGHGLAGDPPGSATWHPVTQRLEKALTKAKPDTAGFVTAKADALPAVRCGTNSVQRVFGIVEGLVRGAETMGWRISPSSGGLVILADGEAVRFSLAEKSDHVAHMPSERERLDKARAEATGRYWTPWPLTDRVPSGVLTFEILENAYGPLTRRFSDLKKRGLEARLDEILAGIAAHAALNIDNRLKREAEQRRAQEAEAERGRDEAFARREAQRLAMVEAIDTQLQERAKLQAVAAHLASIDHEGRATLAAMARWTAFRLKVVEARLSAQSLDISARSAELDFGEDEGRPVERYRYYGRKPELHLWSVDPAKEQAFSVSARRWAIETGALPLPTPAAAEPEGEAE